MNAIKHLDETHDVALQSWVESANDLSTPFPIQNLPLGIVRRKGSTEAWRGGIAIGDQILDLEALAGTNLLDQSAAAAARACCSAALNEFIALGPASWRSLRVAVSRLLRKGASAVTYADSLLIPQADAELKLPLTIGNYSDFFASIHHARRTARIVRGQEDVAPNYRWVPIAYHGRASSVVVSGTPVSRPFGQSMPPGSSSPSIAPSRRLDYELEMAAVVGAENPLGQPVPVAAANDHIFGLCLMNDWSARDIQAFEAMPLGPFLAKSFATTIAPWIVTMAALEPFRVPLEQRADDDPSPLSYLDNSGAAARAGIRIDLEAALVTEQMRRDGLPPVRLTRSKFEHLYWSLEQMVTHQTSNGCNLRVGDILGTGTISGPSKEAAACLLEITEGGKDPVQLPSGEIRIYLEDGDEIEINGYCHQDGFRSIGFGSCRGRIVPANGTGLLA